MSGFGWTRISDSGDSGRIDRLAAGLPALRRRWWLLLPALLGLFWLLPIRGAVVLLPGEDPPDLLALPAGQASHALILPGEDSAAVWPLMQLSPPQPRPGEPATIWLTDISPWAHMRLSVNGRPARYEPPPRLPAEDDPAPRWTWEWGFTMPESGPVELRFYRDCHLGCVERGRLSLAGLEADPAVETPSAGEPWLPTKLGLVFPHPDRDWRGRAGWAVELAYAREPEAPYWGVDDLAARVQAHAAKGQRVLLRLDYDRGQSFPPAGDALALADYLAFARRLAADARLRDVQAYFFGSGFNAADANALAGDRPVTPLWYARVFNGAGAEPEDAQNLVQTLRAVNPQVELLVGPLRPFAQGPGAVESSVDGPDRSDGSDSPTDPEGPEGSNDPADSNGRTDSNVQPDSNGEVAPWLAWFDALLAELERGAAAKAELGLSDMMPDGFALNAPGRPEAPELVLAGVDPAAEPGVDLRRADWPALGLTGLRLPATALEAGLEWLLDGGAFGSSPLPSKLLDPLAPQAGFRVYRDWMAVIDGHSLTRGLPAYITAANTFVPDSGLPPAEGYPAGWLRAAQAELATQPRLRALCWFVDGIPGDPQWGAFQLSAPEGRSAAAAEDFDGLLQGR